MNYLPEISLDTRLETALKSNVRDPQMNSEELEVYDSVNFSGSIIANTHYVHDTYFAEFTGHADHELILKWYNIKLFFSATCKDIKTWAIIDLAAHYVCNNKESFNRILTEITSGERSIIGPLREFFIALEEYHRLDNKDLMIYLLQWFSRALKKCGNDPEEMSKMFLKNVPLMLMQPIQKKLVGIHYNDINIRCLTH